MSNDSKPPEEEPGTASYYSAWWGSADDDAQYWVVQHLAPRRASYQAPFRTQSFPLMSEALAKEGLSDPNEGFFFGGDVVQPASGTVTSAAPEESAQVVYYSGLSPEKPPRKIELPPGSRMLSISNAIFFFSPKARERVCAQAVADFREEYYAALQEGDPAKIRKIVVQHWGGFIFAVALELANMVGRVCRAVRGAD